MNFRRYLALSRGLVFALTPAVHHTRAQRRRARRAASPNSSSSSSSISFARITSRSTDRISMRPSPPAARRRVVHECRLSVSEHRDVRGTFHHRHRRPSLSARHDPQRLARSKDRENAVLHRRSRRSGHQLQRSDARPGRQREPDAGPAIGEQVKTGRTCGRDVAQAALRRTARREARRRRALVRRSRRLVYVVRVLARRRFPSCNSSSPRIRSRPITTRSGRERSLWRIQGRGRCAG